jgi:porphobilinogen synthase
VSATPVGVRAGDPGAGTLATLAHVEPAPGPARLAADPAADAAPAAALLPRLPPHARFPGVTAGGFPSRRLRRLRSTAALRRLVRETRPSVDALVAPLFVREGIDQPVPIESIPGHAQHTVGSLVDEVGRLHDLGVSAVMLFGVPATKDEEGSSAWDPGGILPQAVRALRRAFDDDVVVFTDLCLDEYTSHGHCGVLDSRGRVDNDATLERYQRVALVQADAGADLVAPSGMMDGQVGALRAALDAGGHADVGILAYAAKYASALYGPFREAVSVRLSGGDRRSYQQDPANRREALAEVLVDVAEGADLVMVKPALAYLDVVADVAAAVDVPVAAYQVSGEYAMVKAAAERGWLDGPAVLEEQATAILRAGAGVVLTYAAGELAAAWRR